MRRSYAREQFALSKFNFILGGERAFEFTDTTEEVTESDDFLAKERGWSIMMMYNTRDSYRVELSIQRHYNASKVHIQFL